jgi:hypothetical protein
MILDGLLVSVKVREKMYTSNRQSYYSMAKLNARIELGVRSSIQYTRYGITNRDLALFSKKKAKSDGFLLVSGGTYGITTAV